MKNEPVKGLPGQVILGVLAIGMGLLFLLDNLDIIDFHNAIHFWPMAFILFGVLKIYDTNSKNGYLIGSLLIAAGVLMTLRHLGYLYFTWRTLWPFLLIGAGVAVMFKALRNRNEIGGAMVPLATGDDSVIDVVAVMGGFTRRILSKDFRGGEVTAAMGGCVLDLREASISGEAVVNVFAIFGGITMKVPPDWTVILQGTPILGGFEEKTATPPDTSKRLVVKGYAIMGGVEVRN